MTHNMLTVYHNKKETKLAYVKKDGHVSKPMVVFFCGFRSDMQGTKALFLEQFCQEHELGFIRFDYSGHGQSGGAFEDGTISIWAEDARSIISNLSDNRKIILVGSSMGGWISLLIGPGLGEKLIGFVGLAAAPDFSKDMQKQFSDEMETELKERGHTYVPNDYGEPYIVTRTLLEDGDKQSVLHSPVDIKCPVILLQSKLDSAVKWEKALQIQECLMSDFVEVMLLKDGDHSLSRPQDLKLLAQSIQRLICVYI